MSWRDSEKLYLKDFVAAWHVHDVGIPDPWISRVAQVLKLEYYDMDIEEMQLRLKAKGAQEATPQLDFDAASDDGDQPKEDAPDEGKEESQTLEPKFFEGERR